MAYDGKNLYINGSVSDKHDKAEEQVWIIRRSSESIHFYCVMSS